MGYTILRGPHRPPPLCSGRSWLLATTPPEDTSGATWPPATARGEQRKRYTGEAREENKGAGRGLHGLNSAPANTQRKTARKRRAGDFPQRCRRLYSCPAAAGAARSPHGSQMADVDVQARLHDGHEHVVRAPGVVVHRVPLLPRALLGVRRGPLLREVDHLFNNNKRKATEAPDDGGVYPMSTTEKHHVLRYVLIRIW